MSDYQLANTFSDMVQIVKNIIDAYKMGSVRALAQEPVQNSLDAKSHGKVRVEYRLLRRETDSGMPCHILTVTDSGTCGLQGPLLVQDDLASRGNRSSEPDNWAAFEAQGFTKEDEDALGSRGQGKAAFLYHSVVPGDQRRMLILYDTKLANGKYRLGMRLCLPGDQVRRPPLCGEEALRAVQQDRYEFEGISIPLALKPLQQVGTRIIMPFLSQDALEAFHSGELVRCLQRCWWRAIQTDKLDIQVVDDNGESIEIEVPYWWQDLPRRNFRPAHVMTSRNGNAFMVWENERIGQDRLTVKRLVLLHNDTLKEDEIGEDPGEYPEYAGVQLLRKQQWIETIGAWREFRDVIPEDKQAGFRGFVEFDRDSDRELRKIENSQHDGIDGRKRGYKRAIRSWLRKRVREFATQMNWMEDEQQDENDASELEQKIGKRIAGTFLVPRRPIKTNDTPKDQNHWTCNLELDYPQVGTTRVDYGQELSNLAVRVDAMLGIASSTTFDLRLYISDSTGARDLLEIREGEPVSSGYRMKFGNWRVLQGRANPKKMQMSCPHPGVYTLRAEVHVDGTLAAEDSRRLYVACDPPAPPQQKPQSLSISVVNPNNPDERRVRSRSGDRLLAQISVTNRDVGAFEGFVFARLDDELLVSEAPVSLAGTLAGDSPQRDAAWYGEICLVLQGNVGLELNQDAKLITSEPGRVRLEADLYAREDSEMHHSLSHANKDIWFESDPGATSDLPFLIKSTDKHRNPAMWWLQDEGDTQTLFYRKEYPLRAALKQSSAQVYIEEIVFHGLLEWAFHPVEHGDESNLRQMRDMELDGINPALRDDYQRRLDELGSLAQSSSSSSLEFSQRLRETVALMQKVLRERVA